MHLSLYYYDTCPFCQRVLMAMRSFKNLQIEKRNVMFKSGFAKEQRQATGRSTVPCLRIQKDGDVEWMYESSEIVRYLRDLNQA